MTGKIRQNAAAEVSTGGSLISDAKLKQLYATMIRCRLLTERAGGLNKKKSLSAGLSHASMGQEAIATGWTIDLLPEDSLAPGPGDSVASLIKGAPLTDVVADLYARSNDANHATTDNGHKPTHNIIRASAVAAEQYSAITEVALANKRKKKGHVVVVLATRSATTLPCWDDALKIAAKRSLPIVFAVENNPWFDSRQNGAGSSTLHEGEQFAQTARRYGLPGITVDGNDAVAVYRVAYESLDRVRQGGGPVLVEGKTYRESGAKINPPAERDPLSRMERYLTAKNLFNPGWKDEIALEFSRELDAAVKAARKARRLSPV